MAAGNLKSETRAEIRQAQRDARKLARSAMRGLARRLLKRVKQDTPVYERTMKDAWVTRSTPTGFVLSCPVLHAGVIEAGARPHTVSREGMERLQKWAEVKLGLEPKEAKRAAWGIRKRLEQKGYVGLRFVEKIIKLEGEGLLAEAFADASEKLAEKRQLEDFGTVEDL